MPEADILRDMTFFGIPFLRRVKFTWTEFSADVTVLSWGNYARRVYGFVGISAVWRIGPSTVEYWKRKPNEWLGSVGWVGFISV